MQQFKLEEFCRKHEDAPFPLYYSDAHNWSLNEVLSLANAEERILWNNLNLGYTEIPGDYKLRETIRDKFYQSLSTDQIFCFAGADEGIFCTLYALLESNDHAIILTPCYQSLKEIPMSKGATVSLIELKPENQWKIQINEIEKKINSATKCIIINFPHNPTGQVITQIELEALIQLCKKHDLWLFSDEAYYLCGNPTNLWTPPAVELYDKAISLGVISKAFGCGGLRIGWIACHNKELIQKIEQIKHYTSVCNSAPSEFLSKLILDNAEKILEKNNKIIEVNRRKVDQLIGRHSHILEWHLPEAGCTGFVKYKGTDSVEKFAENLLKKTGVLILPASVYDFQESYFRIGFGQKEIDEALFHLEKYLEDQA